MNFKDDADLEQWENVISKAAIGDRGHMKQALADAVGLKVDGAVSFEHISVL